MLDFKYKTDPKTKETYIETSLSGKPLLTTPQLNKGTAFTPDEREAFGLIGKLPIRVETLEEQVHRAYLQFRTYQDNLKRHIFLNDLHDRNQILFYKLVSDHLSEIMPIIYTPIVGTAVKRFSHEFRQARGLYIAYPEMEHLEQILENRSNPEIDLIVMSDGEGVLGIGDQGIGGIDIPIAKLMVYSLCGGIDPTRTLPIFLDVGTNNQELLNDPLYLGWRHPRISAQEYDVFMERFITVINKKFPNVFLHWEDFGRANAERYLKKYHNQICTFNDDIQGTAVVTLAALFSAIEAKKEKITDQKIVIFGAGTAGAGIAEHIYYWMARQGIEKDIAKTKFYLIDRQGLLLDSMPDLTPAQRLFAKSQNEVANWKLETDNNWISLFDVIKNLKPTILIGASTVAGAFNEQIVKEMAHHVKHPIIFPLSNPTEQAEATPEQIMHWTNGLAFVATGSPFDSFKFNGETIEIAQCNNALAFPGIGLGLIATKPKRLTLHMLDMACNALIELAPILNKQNAPVLPSIKDAKHVAKKIALAVAKAVIKENLAQENITEKDVETVIDKLFWEAKYFPYRKK